MNRKNEILGIESAAAGRIRRSPLKTWGKLTALACFALCVGGCGQKGALYLPSPASAASQPSPSSSK